MQGFGNLGAGKNPTESAEGVDLGQATGVLDPQWVIFFPPPELIWCLILLAYGGKLREYMVILAGTWLCFGFT